MSHQDKEREQRIDLEFLKLKCAKTPETRKESFDRMVAEINQRSAEQVALMESARGLR